MISLIVAMDENRVIGKDNAMPWHLPADLAHFKAVTMGHTVVMGRKTFESIGKPLPGRRNVVLTRQVDFSAEGVEVIHSLEELPEGDVFVIGGAELFRELLPRADRMYLTLIRHAFEGDTFFPEFDGLNWQVVEQKPGVVDERNVYRHTYFTFERK
ncbi:dihydrofolate reductase [Tumebacillus sp. ITR2]|uniref:Dihydrofolate reductase n=1 Tax=Tumebacillus amylolyticus TaxID=2801339 RepID=A0ABS1J4Q4_9BACL|nr:dihydrofolate reductase [Tumebacillus amylolyticus]MBL0385248.1 dihydrofolate reductase [Tumebacillus amylolyticus]